MASEIERDVWKIHDQRLTAHDKEHADYSRSFQAIEDQLKYMIGRIDNGLSPSVQDVKKENSEIKLAITTLDHKLEISQLKMNEKIDIVDENMKKRMEPLEESNRQRDKIYIWAIVGGFVLGLVGFGTNHALKLITDKKSTVAHVEQLKAEPIKKR